MSFTFLFLIVCVGLLLGGVIALVRGKRSLGIGLLVLAMVPVVLFVVFVGTVTGTFPSVWPPPRTPLTDLFKTTPPASLSVVHYKSDAIGMDPSFWWECSPLDETYLKALIQNAGLKRATTETRATTLPPQWPTWWKAAGVEMLPELYFSDTGEGGLRRVWVDRKGNRLFIVFWGT